MSEITKLYKNAKIEPEINYVCDKEPCKKSSLKCCADIGCSHLYDIREDYPDFTAEKQIELIKWLCQKTYRNYIHIRYERDINNWKIECNMVGIREFGNFDECFAGLINNLWQDLTEQERTKIAEILKG